MDSTKKLEVPTQKSQHRAAKKAKTYFNLADLMVRNEREVAAEANCCKATQVRQEELAKIQDDTYVKREEEIPKKTTRKRKSIYFIGVEEFNRLACQQPIPWSNLSRDCIYQLEWVNRADGGIVGNLTNVDGITVSVLLPQFVVDKILMITDTDVKIYIRPRGEDQVDIATRKKYKCKNCQKELASRKFLQRHEKRCTSVLHR